MTKGAHAVILCGGSLIETLYGAETPPALRSVFSGREILVYPFAQDSRCWQKLFPRIVNSPLTQALALHWHLAACAESERRAQAAQCSCALLLGGNELQLQRFVEPDEQHELLNTMDLVAASAGVNIFPQAYYSNDRQRVEHGSGLLPIRTICHFDETHAARYAEFERTAADSPLVRLREGELLVYRKRENC